MLWLGIRDREGRMFKSSVMLAAKTDAPTDCDILPCLHRCSSALLGGDVVRNSGMALSPSPIPVLNRFLSVPSLAPFGRDTCTELGADPTPEGLDLLDMLMVDIPPAELQSEW